MIWGASGVFSCALVGYSGRSTCYCALLFGLADLLLSNPRRCQESFRLGRPGEPNLGFVVASLRTHFLQPPPAAQKAPLAPLAPQKASTYRRSTAVTRNRLLLPRSLGLGGHCRLRHPRTRHRLLLAGALLAVALVPVPFAAAAAPVPFAAAVAVAAQRAPPHPKKHVQCRGGPRAPRPRLGTQARLPATAHPGTLHEKGERPLRRRRRRWQLRLHSGWCSRCIVADRLRHGL
mmetsp:Transcript_73733/g.144199  ORF Transcript_73733/g.144199 Transcript_73733/m.144199 type:complete len:233 (-) Transcript_73733:54-752(-)